jgi:hypothetical protein
MIFVCRMMYAKQAKHSQHYPCLGHERQYGNNLSKFIDGEQARDNRVVAIVEESDHKRSGKEYEIVSKQRVSVEPCHDFLFHGCDYSIIDLPTAFVFVYEHICSSLSILSIIWRPSMCKPKIVFLIGGHGSHVTYPFGGLFDATGSLVGVNIQTHEIDDEDPQGRKLVAPHALATTIYGINQIYRLQELIATIESAVSAADFDTAQLTEIIKKHSAKGSLQDPQKIVGFPEKWRQYYAHAK